MIALVSGTVRHGCVLTASGVGYRVECVDPLVEGDRVELLVEVHGRDGDQRLTGFTDEAQRATFVALCRVPGVGPAQALAVLRTVTPGRLAAAVRDGDTATITAARGVGRKAADTIVARLDLTGIAEPDDATDGDAEAPTGTGDELVDALVGLGHGVDAARDALAGTDGDDADRLAAALAHLAGAR